MFTGRRYDEDTGIYYYRLRDYNPTIGRFMQNDPIGYAGGMNLYAYCYNNPTNFVDPMGLLFAPGLTPSGIPLEIMRVATFYSSTWGEWPDLTEFDYDWTGASSDSQGATKGKELTQTMLFQAMLECYENHILGEEDDDIINFWMNVDTIFFDEPYNSTLYNYNGNVYTGGEINYIGVGMGIRHFRNNKYAIVYKPHIHNFLNHDYQLATPGQVYFTKLGFLYYPLIHDWHQRRQKNNIH